MAMTTNVYGRRNASRTIHIESLPVSGYYTPLISNVSVTGAPLQSSAPDVATV